MATIVLQEKKTMSVIIRRGIEISRAEWKVHKELLWQYDNTNCVYVCKLSGAATSSSSDIIVKMGSSQNIRQRMRNLAYHFQCQPVLVEVLECDMYKQFERFLHRQKPFSQYKYPVLSRETYCLKSGALRRRFLPVLSRHHERFRLSPAARACIDDANSAKKKRKTQVICDEEEEWQEEENANENSPPHHGYNLRKKTTNIR